jgi:hypothetical protein
VCFRNDLCVGRRSSFAEVRAAVPSITARRSCGPLHVITQICSQSTPRDESSQRFSIYRTHNTFRPLQNARHSCHRTLRRRVGRCLPALGRASRPSTLSLSRLLYLDYFIAIE